MGFQKAVVRLGENINDGVADADNVEFFCGHENYPLVRPARL